MIFADRCRSVNEGWGGDPVGFGVARVALPWFPKALGNWMRSGGGSDGRAGRVQGALGG